VHLQLTFRARLAPGLGDKQAVRLVFQFGLILCLDPGDASGISLFLRTLGMNPSLGITHLAAHGTDPHRFALSSRKWIWFLDMHGRRSDKNHPHEMQVRRNRRRRRGLRDASA
jgi:hypothetical protein